LSVILFRALFYFALFLFFFLRFGTYDFFRGLGEEFRILFLSFLQAWKRKNALQYVLVIVPAPALVPVLVLIPCFVQFPFAKASADVLPFLSSDSFANLSRAVPVCETFSKNSATFFSENVKMSGKKRLIPENRTNT